MVNLDNYFLAGIGDNLGDPIPSGVKLIGGRWFSIKRNQPADVSEMIVRFLAPLGEDYNVVGEDFEIIVDVSDHIWEEMPDELE